MTETMLLSKCRPLFKKKLLVLMNFLGGTNSCDNAEIRPSLFLSRCLSKTTCDKFVNIMSRIRTGATQKILRHHLCVA